MSFIRTLFIGGLVDAATRPERNPRLLHAGWFAAIVGVVSLIAGAALGAGFGFSCFGVLALLVGGLLLSAYCFAAKLYGTLAITAVLGLFAVIGAILWMGQTPRSEPTAPARPETKQDLTLPSDTAATVAPRVAAAVATSVKPDGAGPARIYLDDVQHVYHVRACPAVTAKMITAFETYARWKGYAPHSCVPRTTAPAPAATASERAASAEPYNAPPGAHGERYLGEVDPGGGPAGGGTARGTGRGSSGTVHVRGYSRESGTTVAPYTRTAPTKQH